MQIYTAKHVLPISSRPIRDGAVAVYDGRIVDVGPAEAVVGSAPADAVVRELGEAAVLPGLVNAHTHLELSWTAGNDALRFGDYTDWLRSLLALRERGTPADAPAAAERAVAGMIARGTVAVGDVTNDGATAALLARSGLHGVVFFELYGLRTEESERRLTEAVDALERIAAQPDVAAARSRLCLALTPHAPHTTGSALLRALAGRAVASDDRLSVHVAESSAEVALLKDGSGPLAELFRERDFADEGWTPPGRSPVEHLRRLGALSERTLAVHCVRLERADHSTLQTTGATVVTCPRSNAALGVGTAAVPELLREGVPVALGTDSLASAPDLDLFAEIRALRSDHSGLSAAAVLRMATLNGAHALGLADRLGSIESGKLAELIVVPLPGGTEDPAEAICAGPQQIDRLLEAPTDGPGRSR